MSRTFVELRKEATSWSKKYAEAEKNNNKFLMRRAKQELEKIHEEMENLLRS